MELKVKKVHRGAVIPAYESDGAACFDLCAAEDGEVGAFGTGKVTTGLAFETPPGWALMVYSRSGHGFKNGITLVNGTGIIDPDYRGAVQIGLRNDSALTFRFKAGERIAQAMLVPAPCVNFVEVDELSGTARGEGGLGSTGQ